MRDEAAGVADVGHQPDDLQTRDELLDAGEICVASPVACTSNEKTEAAPRGR
jgi:hypothetical protein